MIQNNKISDDQPFRIRPYTKGELACMYIPYCTRKVAMRKFNHWLRYSPQLWNKLQNTNLKIKTRELTYEQVALIVGHLGDP